MQQAEVEAAIEGQTFVSAESAAVPMSVMVLTLQNGVKVMALVLEVFPAGKLEAIAAQMDLPIAPPEVAAVTPGPEAVLNQWE